MNLSTEWPANGLGFPEQIGNNSENSDSQHHASLDILCPKSIKVNFKFVINSTKDHNGGIDWEVKRNCKIIKISSEWSFVEILTALDNLRYEEYPNFFIFIIQTRNAEFCGLNQSTGTTTKGKEIESDEKVKNILIKFGEHRPIILQLKYEDENVIKFFYKEENSKHFLSVDKTEITLENFKDFPTFLSLILNDKIENFEEIIIKKLPKLKNSSLILRLLEIFELHENFFDKLILKCAAEGSKQILLAALDVPFDSDGRILSSNAKNYLANVVYSQQSLSASRASLAESYTNQVEEETTLCDISCISSSNSNQKSSKESSLNKQEEDSSSGVSYVSTYSHLNPSVFHTAIEHGNKEVIDYLISHCTHLIQQLQFKHQIRISSTAFESNQIDVMCDMLELSDFPFPQIIEITSVKHERLRKIGESRIKLHVAIATENFEEISNFIDNNLSLRVVYDPTNKSALKQAADSKKFNVYYHLKSIGFQATEFDDLEEILDPEDLKDATKFKIQQRRKNINEALRDGHNSVMILSTKSFIHNRKISNEQEVEYRMKIRKWYEDINKIEFGCELLNVAASCENLKIIFDFESNSVRKIFN